MVKVSSKKNFISYINRQSGLLEEEYSPSFSYLKWLYYKPFGRLSLFVLVKRKFLSSFYGNLMDKYSSRKKIKPFIDSYDVDMSDSFLSYKLFNSFNDFFTRKLNQDARDFSSSENLLVSPCDGKILAFDKTYNFNSFYVKGQRFSLASFFKNKKLAERFLSGSFCIICLAPSNYHRFHFPFSGNLISSHHISGSYYSVSPIALRKRARIFCENKRSYSILHSDVFGDVAYCEVGATMVGSIVQTFFGRRFSKGEEKGYFQFGGSTILLFFEKNKVIFDIDLINNTKLGLETSIKAGDSLGVSANLIF
ncbi:phosphatidylserine decarboxylase [Candidatus Woesearchaeota archaeon]|nr:phosphatidylserine decarboxylase [Candidatus Woesearchaeota archaeon]